jgi:beta-hydroxylase
MVDHPPVLRDPDLDARLQRDGFVVLPALAAGPLQALREWFLDERGHTGDGFQTDLVLDDPDYRVRSSQRIGEALDEAVVPLFHDRVPFLRSFICKYPGSGSELYIHRDWMYVDERQGHRTYVAWVALQDIDGHNGQLRVLRGSHRLDPSLRGTDLVASWIDRVDVIEPRLLSVPVKAGEVVVFDNALVHSSFPNHTDEPRVVAAVGLRPSAAPLVHFRRHDEGHADRYDVDERFFLTATPQALMAAPPDLPVAEVVDLAPSPVAPDELASLLDQGRLAKVDRAHQAVARARLASIEALGTAAHAVREAATGAATKAGQARRQAVAKRRLRPVDERPSRRERWRAARNDLQTKAAIAVLGLNEATINRFGPPHDAVWDPAEFPWSAAIEAGWADVHAEVAALLRGPTEIPHIEDVTGGIPQGNIGPWRTFVLMHQGRWIPWNCERCPKTTELVRNIPGLTVAGFSVLEPGTHITTHRGPNKGALRYQLGVIVPGAEGDCRIRVGDDMLIWREGEGVMFDFTTEHEAWNDSDGIRVLLMLELITPLPWYLAGPNRLAQHAMGWFPTTRDMAERLRKLEPSLLKQAS